MPAPHHFTLVQRDPSHLTMGTRLPTICDLKGDVSCGKSLSCIVIQALNLGHQWRVREESVFEERVGEERFSGGHCKNSPGITFIESKYFKLLNSFIIIIANLIFYSMPLITQYIHEQCITIISINPVYGTIIRKLPGRWSLMSGMKLFFTIKCWQL